MEKIDRGGADNTDIDQVSYKPSLIMTNVGNKYAHAEEWHKSLQWRHNGRDGVSNHQPYDCLFNRLFKVQIKETSTFRITGLSA